MNTLSILIVDDCDNFRMVASHILLDAGHVVEQANCAHDAFDLIRKEKFDIIFCDLHMPFINGEKNEEFQTSYQVGIMTINALQDLFPNTPVLALTSTPPVDLARIKSALKGINAYSKPTSKDELFKIVDHAREIAEHGGCLQ